MNTDLELGIVNKDQNTDQIDDTLDKPQSKSFILVVFISCCAIAICFIFAIALNVRANYYNDGVIANQRQLLTGSASDIPEYWAMLTTIMEKELVEEVRFVVDPTQGRWYIVIYGRGLRDDSFEREELKKLWLKLTLLDVEGVDGSLWLKLVETSKTDISDKVNKFYFYPRTKEELKNDPVEQKLAGEMYTKTQNGMKANVQLYRANSKERDSKDSSVTNFRLYPASKEEKITLAVQELPLIVKLSGHTSLPPKLKAYHRVPGAYDPLGTSRWTDVRPPPRHPPSH